MSIRKLFSLVFIRNQQQILLGLKKRGFGERKWNGFGGKVLPHETLVQGALREVKEECGLKVTDLQKIGLLQIEFEGSSSLLDVYVFETRNYRGKIIESEEMRPQWFDLKNIPYNDMWPDNSFWFPHMLQHKPFKINVLYRGIDQIAKHQLEVPHLALKETT